jgi:carbon-monoxide dehydrogenase large subunit
MMRPAGEPPFKKGTATVLGQSVTRLEDPPLVTGKGRFVNNLSFPGQVHMRVVRSDIAHGKIIAIGTESARSMPGVVAVWTAADIADLGPIDFRDPAAEALAPFRQPLLAITRVRYVGEPVAVVFADDPYRAEDAAELIMAEIEPLAPQLDATAAPSDFSDGHTTEALIIRSGFGDAPAAFAAPHLVVSETLTVGRHSGVPLECRGAIGRYDRENDVIELWGAAKVPHRNRESLAKYFKRPYSGVQLFEGHVGGGFGVRGELYPEDFLVCAASMRLGRPVKWIEDRRENLMATNHSRQQHHDLRMAFDAEGRILGLTDEFYLDQGGYIRTHGVRVTEMTIGMLPGPYRVPVYSAIGHVRLTNKTPCGTYRSPGRYEGTFVRERLLDIAAQKLGLDRLEIRRRNLLTVAELPHRRSLTALGTDVELDSGDYLGLLESALARFGWRSAEEDVRRRRSKGELVGLGLTMFLEKSGLGPTDSAIVTVEPAGTVEVVTGGASLGQGFETAMAQICAETLGIDYRMIRVVHGQTNRIRHGIGAHATRATVMTGNAVHAAALKLRDTVLRRVSTLLQTRAEDLEISEGIIARRDASAGPSITLSELVRQTGELSAEGTFETDHMTYPYGVHMAVVRVDSGTGMVAVERYFVANDVGRAVNPMLIDGQITGGAAQGIGGALFEEFRYDEQGQPLSVTLADYLIPTAHEIPNVEVMITEDAPSPLNPLGVKGAGEGGCAGVGATIASAIDDAIGMPGAITRLPVTPQAMCEILSRLKPGR